MAENSTFNIAPTELHWINSESARSDLCAHGKVHVTLDAESLINVAPGNLCVSTGALHLMRTLESNHTVDHPVAEQLIPHCGHYMYVDEQGRLQYIGCPAGLNWWVKHEGVTVILEFPTGRQYSISADQWWRAVTSFADMVAAFYDATDPKLPQDVDEEWFAAFWTEWRHLRSISERGA